MTICVSEQELSAWLKANRITTSADGLRSRRLRDAPLNHLARVEALNLKQAGTTLGAMR